MTNCESVQAKLLNYLYELLEEEDQRAVESHLAGCERCQAALTAARGKQKLLAKAAKKQFPQVHFDRPRAKRPAAAQAGASAWSVRALGPGGQHSARIRPAPAGRLVRPE